jgi:hypothetical protein
MSAETIVAMRRKDEALTLAPPPTTRGHRREFVSVLLGVAVGFLLALGLRGA